MAWSHARLLILAFVGILAAPSVSRADIVSEVLKCDSDPCVVSFNPGGEIGAFKAAARAIKASGRRVVINGPCLSACAILADEARGSVCVTSKARFGFHKGFVLEQPMAGGPARFVKRFNPKHSRDIAGWVSKNGGYPSKGFRYMNAGTAKRIWRACG